MLIFACPGQGSQSEGFLAPWLDAYPSLREKLHELSEACGRDLIKLGTESSEDAIRDTANAQRLIVGATIAVHRVVFAGIEFDGVVGHSVGEYAAAAIAGVITDEEAMKLVGVRADAMAEAASLVQTSMAAVLGGDEVSVIETLTSLGLEPANFNGGQIVAAGKKDAIANLVTNPPEKTRVIELKVAGAFHTTYMLPAVEKVREAARVINARDPLVTLWSNADGKSVSSGSQYLASLVEQIAKPVRWDLCMGEINQTGNKVVELPPAGALSGLLKRGASNVTAIALKNPTDVEKVS